MLPIRINWWRGFWRDRRFLLISLTVFFALALDSLSLLRSVSDDGGRTGDLGLNNQRLKRRSVDSSPMNNDPINEENDDYDETQFRVGRRILYENESFNEIDGKKVPIPMKKLNMNYQEAKQRDWDRKNCVPRPKGAAPAGAAGGNGTAPAAAGNGTAAGGPRIIYCEDLPPLNGGNGTAVNGTSGGNGTAPAAGPAGAAPAPAAPPPAAAPPA